MNLDRLTWRARLTRPARRRWTRAELARLHAWAGKRTPLEMARALKRPLNSILSKAMQLGYRISADLMQPIGLTAVGVARRIGAPYCQLYRLVQSGRVIAPIKANKKDYLIRWADVRRLERHYGLIARRREQTLARINEPTISKPAFMRLLGLSETHGARYLAGGIVRAWKVPCRWSDIPRARWEWRVSRRDARRVKKLRESGHLKLRAKRYRQIQRATNAEITRLRRERRLGLRDELRRQKQPLVPGTYTVAQVAQLARLSETDVYEHIRLGRLKARRVPVGRRNYIVVDPVALAPYLQWCSRLVKATGPIVPRRRQIQSVLAAGLLTISAAAREYRLNRGTLQCAVSSGRIPSIMIDGMRGLRRRDVAAYAAQIIRRRR